MRGMCSIVVFVAAVSPFAGVAAQAPAPAVRSTNFHNVHLRVADPAAAAEWYIKTLGATRAPAPFSVAFGRTLIALVRAQTPKPSEGSAIDHIGISYSDLRAKMKEFEAAGAKMLRPVAEAKGMFAYMLNLQYAHS